MCVSTITCAQQIDAKGYVHNVMGMCVVLCCVVLQGVDFWAFGILIYEMLCGGTPFADEEHSRIFVKIVHSQV